MREEAVKKMIDAAVKSLEDKIDKLAEAIGSSFDAVRRVDAPAGGTVTLPGGITYVGEAYVTGEAKAMAALGETKPAGA